jgi:hypothetical protein
MASVPELASQLKAKLPKTGYSPHSVRAADAALDKLLEQAKASGDIHIAATPTLNEVHAEALTASGAIPRACEDTRVAIVGYSCILPGGENVAQTWEMIQVGRRPLRPPSLLPTNS